MWRRRDFLKLCAAASAGYAGSSVLEPSTSWAQGVPSHGGTMIVGQSSEPTYLTVALQANNAAAVLSPKIFDGLIDLDFDMNPVPQLAESWEWSEDGLKLAFKLRPGVQWHDGQPFSSKDAEFSFNEVWTKFNPRAATLFQSVTGVEAPEPLTFVVNMSKPAPYLIKAFVSTQLQILPRHVYEGTDLVANPANAAPIGTGPFKFAEWERGSHVRLRRNEAYWDQPKPYLDEVIYRFIPDAAARSAALEAEEVTYVSESNVPGNDLPRLANLPYIDITREGYKYLGSITLFMFNLDRPIFQDVRVRQAIAHSIDRDFIIKNIWFGYGKPSTGPYPRMLQAFYHPDVPSYPFDPEKAGALLDAAGYPRGADGKRFTIMHDHVPLGEAYLRVGEYVRNMLAQIGVELRIRNQDMGAFVRRVFTDRDWDTANYLISIGPDPVIGGDRLYASNSFKVGSAWTNGPHYSNAEVDRLLREAAEAHDFEQRKKLYAQFQRIAMEEIPQIPLVDVELVSISNKSLKGHTTGLGPNGNFAGAYFDRGG